MGQKLSFNQTEILTGSKSDMDKYYKFLDNNNIIIESTDFIGEKSCILTYKQKKESLSPAYKQSIPIAAYTTAYARLRLNQGLEIFNENVIYMDTDSIYYIKDKNEKDKKIVLGNLLGDFENDLKKSYGDYIQEFYSSGPKSYSYITDTGYEVCKIKGIPLNIKNQNILNVKTMKQLILEKKENESLYVEDTKFKLDKNRSTIETIQQKKKFNITFDKRRILPLDDNKILTVPFGYQIKKKQSFFPALQKKKSFLEYFQAFMQ
jgi:hypothetical protein